MQEILFVNFLPEDAFVSNFTLTTEGETFVAEVTAREEADDLYNNAKNAGQDAAILKKQIFRDANKVGL